MAGAARTLFAGDLVIGDYGGLEARLAAHFSEDPVMLDIYRSGKDLYGVMAARAWGGDEDKSNPGRGLDALRRVLDDAAGPDLMIEGAR